MKKVVTLVWLFLSGITLHATDIVQFRISKPYCLLNFMETMIHGNGTSSTLQKYIAERVAKEDTTFKNLVKDYNQLQLDYSYTREEYPENRHRNRSTHNLINIAAVQSANLADLKTRTIGILPNSEHRKLFAILGRAEDYYNRIIWNDYEQKIILQVKELEKNKSRINEIFTKLQHFYRSDWSADLPFIVAIYPIPGRSGNTTATPNGNSLCVGMLTDEKDYTGRTAVILHEMCHVLYDEQPNLIQHRIERYFQTLASPYKIFANNFFDEGLATALGNGWSYEYMNGTTDTTEWYNNEYINGFGHALYPLVKEYIHAGKSIDSIFVVRAVQNFAQTFPKANADYAALLNRVDIYSDAESKAERNDMMTSLYQSFQITNSNSSSPILHAYSIKSLRESENTQLIIIDRNHKTNLAKLKELFPELKGWLKGQAPSSSVISFFDKNQRPVIILNANAKQDLSKLILMMQKEKYIDRAKPVKVF